MPDQRRRSRHLCALAGHDSRVQAPGGPGIRIETFAHAECTILKIEKNFKENMGYEKVFRAPFGWTKELNLKIKGHPLAENSKAFTKKEEGKGEEKEDANNKLIDKNEGSASSSSSSSSSSHNNNNSV